MIGSLMSRLDEAQNLSVSQLQKAVQDGTLPAYIGIPLIQDKIQLQKAAQAPQMPPQPPIAQQVMQEADGIDKARTNLPVRMAPGGIVGMDPEDSDYDDPLLQSALEDIDREQSQYGAQNVNMPMGEGISAAIMATSDNTKPAFSSITKPVKEGIEKLSNFINRTPKVDEVTKEKPSLYENFIGAIRHIESRGNRYDSLGRLLESPKGAKGEMQVMDKTFKDPGFGVTPARDNSAEERRRVGEDYAIALLNKYQDPVIAGMAYNAGPGRIDKWLASGMKEKLPQETVDYGNKVMNIINKFKEGGITKLKEGEVIPSFSGPSGSFVTDAYRSGYDRIFGNSNPAIEGSTSTLPPLTTEEVLENLKNAKAAAQRPVPVAPPSSMRTASEFKPTINTPSSSMSELLSSLKKFGSSSDANVFPNMPNTGGIADLNYYNELLMESQKNPNYQPYKDEIAKLLAKNPSLESQSKKLTPFANIVNPYDVEDFEAGQAMNVDKTNKTYPDQTSRGNAPKMFSAKEPSQINVQGANANIPSDLAGIDTLNASQKESPYAGYLQAMQDQLGELKNQKEEDKYMSLLAAGLGMMGGTSPFAGVNIGQGALAGVQNYANAAKQRGAEQAALYRNMLYGKHFADADELARAKLAQEEQFKNILYGQKAESLSEVARKNKQAELDRALAQHALLDSRIVNQANIKYPTKNDVINPQNATLRENYIAQQYQSPFYKKSLQRAMPDIDLTELETPNIGISASDIAAERARRKNKQ